MLKRLYVNNYKSLVNFELKFGKINLLLGKNGGGKSTVFEVLKKLTQLLVGRQKIDQLFSTNEITRWLSSPEQTFELVIQSEDGDYLYKLVIFYEIERGRNRIKSESLTLGGQPLLMFEEGNAQLYRDDGSQGPKYPFDWMQSAVALLPERRDNQKLTAFKEQMAHLLVIHPLSIAPMMSALSPQETTDPGYYLEHFASWYRYLIQDGGFSTKFTNELREVMLDFESLSFDSVGKEEKLLKVKFKNGDSKRTTSYEFQELSDGQRMLIALYLLLYLPDHQDSEPFKFMLCLDEPENFVALPEIQPWLSSVYDRSQDREFQIILISHHPEFINYLLMPDNEQIGYWFERESNLSPVRVQPIKTIQEQDSLPASELIARGWWPDEEG